MVKVRYHAEVSVVKPPSFESDCEMQEWEENASATGERLSSESNVDHLCSSSLMQVPSDKG